MIPLPSGTKIWLVAGITDMCNGFNGLAAKVQTALKYDPMSGHIFIFRGGSQVKLLWSTGDGLCLLTKRLERGRFAWSSAHDSKAFLTTAQLAMLIEGIGWRQPIQNIIHTELINRLAVQKGQLGSNYHNCLLNLYLAPAAAR
ncbi:IS66 family insertion sequence element accessory protein TnpB [Klebsiella michiganensis]|nr:IS66 family insertion sequence element accessory protein TnpB [Kluyvera ascorbata]EMB3266420.1 IS66 family insertion sequence element accessory protein TnpB [Klebsiella michiganensis]